MPDTLEKQDRAIPRWEMMAAAVPVLDGAGGARVRAINHLGHTVDVYFPPSLWKWVANKEAE